MLRTDRLLEWLETDEARSRASRAKRLRVLIKEFGGGNYRMFHGQVAAIAFEEARQAYLHGLFVAFVDDDDDVSDDYISKICQAISRHKDIDCVGIKGIITFRGRYPREFSHSVKYQDYFSCRHAYFRPPYHLNPILRAIALRFSFRAVSYSEDVEWALRVQRAGVLRREEFIDTPLYFYKSRRWWSYQRLVDWSEPLRHALGLRMVNRLLLSAPPPSAE